jgi:putative sigma-54 modulation protein
MNKSALKTATVRETTEQRKRNKPRNPPLDILIRTDGVELNKKLREAVHAKIGRVRQYAPRALGARVQLIKTGTNPSANQYRAHVLYAVKGNDVSAQHRAHDPLAALDIVAEKIERRLRKRKTAMLARRVRNIRKGRQLKLN